MTTNQHQQGLIVEQQKTKEFSRHTPLTKDADRGDAPENPWLPIADRCDRGHLLAGAM
jgi:hypothetical protein